MIELQYISSNLLNLDRIQCLHTLASFISKPECVALSTFERYPG